MCVFCAAIPTTAATGMALDRKVRKQTKGQLRPFYLRPFMILTLLGIVVCMALSILIHSRGTGV